MPGGSDPDNRRDFPGGFPGDGIDKFAASGRTKVENDVWDHVAKLAKLRQELEPLRRGRTLDLLDEEQQMAYARVTAKDAVIVVFNNDTKPATVGFDFSMIKQFAVNQTFVDRLGSVRPVNIHNSRLTFEMPPRSAAILVDGTK